MKTYLIERTKKLSSCASFSMACLLAVGTMAQVQAATQEETNTGNAGGTGLEEIIVTAQKQASTEQRTPVAVSVFTPELLERDGISNLGDLLARAPNANYSRQGNASIITLRGVSSRDITEIGDPSVSINQDGVYFTRSLGLSEALFDLERVEVLRGPQGTLYGRNATGGVINFISARPTQELEGNLAIGVGNYGAKTLDGVVNIPVSDQLQVRAAIATRDHDGFRDNSPAKDGDDQDTEAGRISVAMQPTEQLDIVLRAEYISVGGAGGVQCGIPFAFDGNGDVIHEMPASLDSEKCPHDTMTIQKQDVTTTSFRGNVNYDLGFAELSYQGGYRELDFESYTDQDASIVPFVNSLQAEVVDTWNHEIRLASIGEQRFTWQFGAFYAKDENELATDAMLAAVSPPLVLAAFRYDIEFESKAAFAHGSFEVVDDVKLSAGIRYSKDEKTRSGLADYTNLGGSVLSAPGDYSESNTTYHIGIDWQVTPDSLLYAKFDTGYKAGGFTDLAPYDAETIEAYEIGSKNRFLDNRLQLNASAYFYDLTDQQVSQIVGVQTFITNAGATEIFGVELEAIALLTESDRLEFFLSYTNGEYQDFLFADPLGGPNLQLAGNVPPQAPEWASNLAYEHSFVLSNDATLTARFQTHFESKSYLQFTNYNSEKQDSYTRSDFMLTYESADAHWNVQAYVRNIEDEDILTDGRENSLFGYLYSFADPRTYGIRVKYSW